MRKYSLGDSRIIRPLIAVFVACIALLLLTFTGTVHHGLTRTITGPAGYLRLNNFWHWPYFDGADYSYQDMQNAADTVRFDGFVWQGEPGETTWRIVHTGAITVLVDGETILSVKEPLPVTESLIPVRWSGDSLHLQVTYSPGTALYTIGERRIDMGIYTRDLFGFWHLLPNHRLYRSPPDAYALPTSWGGWKRA